MLKELTERRRSADQYVIVARQFDKLRARNELGDQPPLLWRDDSVAGTMQNQGRHPDLPGIFSNVDRRIHLPDTLSIIWAGREALQLIEACCDFL